MNWVRIQEVYHKKKVAFNEVKMIYKPKVLKYVKSRHEAEKENIKVETNKSFDFLQCVIW